MLPRVAMLLFGSGFCSLIYQTVWMREFRLVFGASTAANAAVLAVFMGGLGAGGAWLGRRVDGARNALGFYAVLELLIPVTALLSLPALDVARAAYIAVGGSSTLGDGGATVVRLVLAAGVLALPTFLMGGTLAAAARAVERQDDLGGSATGWLYGLNTLGAVVGTLASTFLLLEMAGNRQTLILAALCNLLVGVAARSLARSPHASPPPSAPRADTLDAGTGTPSETPPTPLLFPAVAAAVVGAVFLLMEIVWYRMLAPVLGGSVFTFGLVLATALAGIGAGGALYGAVFHGRRAREMDFALSCLVQGLCMGIPFALGDRIALGSQALRELSVLGFPGQALGWTLVCAVTVGPAALVSGFQFPLLVALAKGPAGMGQQVGRIYAANTLGSVVGSLAGGFGLLPALGAPGCWKLAVACLCILGAVVAIRGAGRALPLWLAAAAAPVVMVQLALGPTAFWRHTAVGAGRNTLPAGATPEQVEAIVRDGRVAMLFDQDGLESSVGVRASNSLSPLINGKADGSFRADASTQVMGSLLPALLVPATHTALVVGLGTGSSAGWLAKVPGVERVDAVELEPKVVATVPLFKAVNQDAMENPALHVITGDAREHLLTTRSRYDVIFSEPSNPYRAGIASLFTVEFYQAARARLTEDGVFAQWVQTYELDAETLRTILATMAAVFPDVQVWRLHPRDMLVVGRPRPRPLQVEEMRSRVAMEPWKSALGWTWRTNELEGVLSHHAANNSFIKLLVEGSQPELNTDDRSIIEFGFARTLGLHRANSGAELHAAATQANLDHPVVDGPVDWERVEESRTAMTVADHEPPEPGRALPPDARHRQDALTAWYLGDFAAAVAHWQQQPSPPLSPMELAAVAESLANLGLPGALPLLDRLAVDQPVEAGVARAHYLLKTGDEPAALTALVAAGTALQTHPWARPGTEHALIELLYPFARHAGDAEVVLAALKTPWVGAVGRLKRVAAAAAVAHQYGHHEDVAALLAPLEPWIPWNRALLTTRATSYASLHHPLQDLADSDLLRFLEQQPSTVMPPHGGP